MPLSPEQRSLRASIAAHTAWAGDRDRKATGRIANAGLRAKFEREVRAKWPDLPEEEILRRADHAFKAHMLQLSFKASKARTARKAAKSSGGDHEGD
jgi:hypothetical protein